MEDTEHAAAPAEDTAPVEQSAPAEDTAPAEQSAPAEDTGAEDSSAPSVGWSDTLAYLQQVSPDAYQHAKGMQRDYVRKTEALAAERREMEARAEMLQQQEARLQSMMAALSGTPPDELPDYDPFNADSVIAHTQQRIYEQHIAPLQQQAAEEQARLQLATVQRENADIFEDPETKSELVTFLKERPAYKLTDAIEVIRARLQTRQAQQQAAVRTAQRQASRAAALTATAGTSRQQGRLRKPARSELRKMTNTEIMQLAAELDRGH